MYYSEAECKAAARRAEAGTATPHDGRVLLWLFRKAAARGQQGERGVSHQVIDGEWAEVACVTTMP